MSAPVNLNKARKAHKKIKIRQQADENAAKYGLTKPERALAGARNQKSKTALDQHKLHDK